MRLEFGGTLEVVAEHLLLFCTVRCYWRENVYPFLVFTKESWKLLYTTQVIENKRYDTDLFLVLHIYVSVAPSVQVAACRRFGAKSLRDRVLISYFRAILDIFQSNFNQNTGYIQENVLDNVTCKMATVVLGNGELNCWTDSSFYSCFQVSIVLISR